MRQNKKKKEEVPKALTSNEEFDFKLTQEQVGEILGTTRFDAAIGVVIALNAVTIGLEQSFELDGKDTTGIQVCESIFLVIYIVELGMRYYAFRREMLRDMLVLFDIFLVFFGVLNSWILEIALDEVPEEFGLIMLLRTARLLRLAKTARLLKRIPAFWLVVRGLLTCVQTMGTSLIVFAGVLFVFASLGIELITKHKLNIGANPDEEFQRVVRDNFHTLPATMLTLLQFFTMDNIADIYKPLIFKDPWLALYFISVIFIVSIVLANLLFAAIICGAMEANQVEADDVRHAQEDGWAKLVSNLKDMFTRLDEDRSGMLSLEEFLNINQEDQEALCKAMECDKPAEIFRMLDHDRVGELSINVFFDGILDKLLAAGATNFKRMERQIETMHWRLKESFSEQLQMHQALDRLLQESAAAKGEAKEKNNSSSTAASSSDRALEPWEEESLAKLRQIADECIVSAMMHRRKGNKPTTPRTADKKKTGDFSSGMIGLADVTAQRPGSLARDKSPPPVPGRQSEAKGGSPKAARASSSSKSPRTTPRNSRGSGGVETKTDI